MTPITLSVTGHRPGSFPDGYGIRTDARLLRLATWAIATIGPDHVNTGMAQGWDTACALAASHLGIPYTAILAYRDQCEKWPDVAQQRYRRLLAGAADVVCENSHWHRNAYRQRDRLLATRCDLMLACWNGDRATGTGVTVGMCSEPQYERLVLNVWDWY